MKILLVDDESRKLKKLYGLIKSVDDVKSDCIEHVLDLKSAKAKMTEFLYDLVILDLNISDFIEEEIHFDEIAGLNFIDEIIGIDSIRKPREIIILTEYEELRQKCVDIGKNLEFQVLKFDDTATEWESTIKAKIKYILEYEKSLAIFSDFLKCDIAILCAVPVEEEAVKRSYGKENWNLLNYTSDPTNYYFIENRVGNNVKKIVLAKQSEMGMAAASTLTSKVMYHFKPKYIIMVGIAAGIGKEKNYGDIIIPNEVWNYSSGKYSVNEDNNELIDFLPDPKSLPLSSEIERIITLDYSEVLYKIKKNWVNNVEHDLKIVIGPLACGTAVVANSKIVETLIKKHSRKTVGLDMESYGVFYSVENGISNNTTAICIKSICDFADVEKGDNYQKYAAYTSSMFAKHIIEEVLDIS